MFNNIKQLKDSEFIKVGNRLKIIDYDYYGKVGKLIVYGNDCYACKEHSKKYKTKENAKYKDATICVDNENCQDIVNMLNIPFIPKIFEIKDSGEGYSYVDI